MHSPLPLGHGDAGQGHPLYHVCSFEQDVNSREDDANGGRQPCMPEVRHPEGSGNHCPECRCKVIECCEHAATPAERLLRCCWG